jgi:hypothetical protein
MDHGLRLDNGLSRFRHGVLQPFDHTSVFRPFVVRMFVRRLYRRVNADRACRVRRLTRAGRKYLFAPQQIRQLGDIGGDPPGFVAGQPAWRWRRA